MSDDILELADLDLDMPAGAGGGGDFGNKSANFGGGLELLMNDSVKDKNSASSDMQLDDLTQLENQLNELVEPSSSSSGGGGGVSFSFGSGGSGGHDDLDNLDDMDDFGGGSSSSSKGKGSSSSSSSAPHVGRATAQSESGTKRTWDGYAKFNNIPMNPDANVGGGRRGGGGSGANPERDELREKTNLIRKLEQLEKKSGVELKRRPTMEMTLDELTIEYESIVEDRRKQNSIKFQGNMLMACINGLEYFNNAIDPFDLKLDGWSEQIQENIDDYDDIFGELHEKYKDRVAVSPELRLLFQLGGSAVMVHMSNTMLKSAMPSADQLFKLYPELGRDMNRAAVNQMAQTAPNFANFATNIMGVGGGGGVGGSASGAGGSSSSGGSRIVSGPAMPDPAPRRGPGPPPPIATQGPYAAPPPLVRPGNNQHAHPELFQNSQGNNVNNNNNNKRARTEMRGPGDISDILSGLKTRTISVPPAAAASTPSAQNTRGQNPPSQSSVPGSPVSVASFTVDGGASVNSSSVKRSNRRKRSSTNNVMSIDI